MLTLRGTWILHPNWDVVDSTLFLLQSTGLCASALKGIVIYPARHSPLLVSRVYIYLLTFFESVGLLLVLFRPRLGDF